MDSSLFCSFSLWVTQWCSCWGKTSLLKAITGAVPAARGSVEVMRGTRIGYVPQVESVDWNFPITVGEVLATPFNPDALETNAVELTESLSEAAELSQ